MYLNRQNIELIKQVREKAQKFGLTVAQTNSRRNGHYLDAVRIYLRPEDKSHVDRAWWTCTSALGLRVFLKQDIH